MKKDKSAYYLLSANNYDILINLNNVAFIDLPKDKDKEKEKEFGTVHFVGVTQTIEMPEDVIKNIFGYINRMAEENETPRRLTEEQVADVADRVHRLLTKES